MSKMKHLADQFVLVFPDLICMCGERWSGAIVPKHLRTIDYLKYTVAEWKKKHGEHVSNVQEIEKTFFLAEVSL